MESVLIRFETDTTSLDQAQKRIEAIEAHNVEIKCEAAIDGRVIQTNIQEALKKAQDGKINQFKLKLDMSALTKQLDQAKSIVSKKADDIQSDFEKATKSRTKETLRKNLIGKKSISGNSTIAQEEINKYYSNALEKVNEYKFDATNLEADVDVERVYNYTKALAELKTVMEDVHAIARDKGLAIGIDFEKVYDGTVQELRTVQQNAVDILQNFGKTKTDSLPPLIEQIKSQFMELPGILSGEVSTSASAVIDDLKAKLAEARATIEELQNTIKNGATPAEYEALTTQLLEAENNARKLEETIVELKGKLSETSGTNNGMTTQLDSMEKEAEEYKRVITELKAALANKQQGNVGGATSTELQTLLNTVNQIAEALASIKSVLVDVGDGQEFSPLLQTINNVSTAVNDLQSSVSKLKFNVNLDLGGTDEKGAMKIEGRKQELLSAYQQQFAAMKNYAVEAQKIVTSIFKSPSDKSLITDLNKSIALFDESQYDNIDQKIKAYESIIMKMREVARLQYGEDAYSGLDAHYQKQVTQAKSNLTRVISSVKTESMEDVNNLFGKTDFTAVISQLDIIAQKLDEITGIIKNFGELDLKSVTDLSSTIDEISKVSNAVNELKDSIGLLRGNAQKKINTSTYAQELIKGYGVEGSEPIKNVRRQVNQLVGEMTKAFNGVKIDPNLLSDRFDEILNNLARTMAEGSSQIKDQMTDVYKAFYDDYKNTKIYISDGMKKALGEEYKNIFNSGLITRDISKGIDLNSIWEEMSGRYPDIIDFEITNDGDQVLAFVKAMQKARAEMQKIKFSDLTPDFQEGLLTDAYRSVSQMVNKIRPELERALKSATNVTVVDTQDESSQMTTLAAEVDKVIDAVKKKNQAFEEERGVVSSVVSDELTQLSDLLTAINNVTDAIKKFKDAFSNTGKKAGSFKDLEDALKNLQGPLNSLSQDKVDLLENLGKAFDSFSNAKIKGKSFTNLIDGIKDLSSADLTQLEKLKNIDFSGLANLKYVKQADSALAKQSKNFIDSQSKQIDNALSYYRKVGVDESSLTDIKDLRTLLNTNFTAVALSGVQDVNGEMTSFVTLLSDAIKKADLLAENIKKSQQAAAQNTKDASQYDTLLTRERQLLQKKIKNGSLGNEDTLLFNETVKQRRALEKNNNISTDRRQAIYDDAREDYLDKINNAIAKAEKKLKDKTEDDFTDPKVYQDASNALTQLKEIRDNFIAQGKGKLLDSEIENVHNLEKAIDALSGSIKKQTKVKGTVIGNVQSAVGSKEAIEEVKEMIRLQEEAKGNRVEFDKTLNDDTGLAYSVATKEGSLQKYIATIDQASKAVTTLKKSEEPYVSQGQKFINSIKGKFAELTRYMSVMSVFQKALSFIKKGVTAVREIDTAMTELKKVTDETSASYERFVQASASKASEVGGTAQEYISATADFSRVGNSFQKSQDLAQQAIKLKNVSEFDTVQAATESLISMTQAYSDVDPAEIVDIMNILGNNFAISTDEISEALQRSASALTTAGNDIYESSALITAGNTILQDADSVAAGMRTIALRISGTSTEVLEKMGEDTDGVVETTSKLQDQVMALTAVNGGKGVSLLDDNGNYRSTYEILQDIADIYDDILAADKADGQNRANALGEMLAGKNRSNILASILQNPEILRNAYETAQNSSGSADAELAKWEESIDAHIQKLTNSFQSLWANALDSSIINFFIDLGTTILNITDNVGLLNAAISTLTAVASFKGAGGTNKKQLFLKLKMPAISCAMT